jgi:hypothetical protein
LFICISLPIGATTVEEIHLPNKDQMQVVFEEKNLQQLSLIDPFTEKVLIAATFSCNNSLFNIISNHMVSWTIIIFYPLSIPFIYMVNVISALQQSLESQKNNIGAIVLVDYAHQKWYQHLMGSNAQRMEVVLQHNLNGGKTNRT